MGKTVLGLRDEYLLWSQKVDDGSDKVACEEGTLRKRALKRVTRSKVTYLNNNTGPLSLDHRCTSLSPQNVRRRKMLNTSTKTWRMSPRSAFIRPPAYPI
jgi:hypothetical protein